jgi:hypothetical protein
MYPSSNIPSLQDIQEQYRKAAERARGRDVASPFAAATGEMARGRAMELEALNRQQIQAQRQQQAMSRDTGMEMLGGNMAGEQRFRQAVAEGGQRYNQAASQLGIQQAQAEQARDARADAMDLQATGVGAQFAAMQRKEQMQMQLAQLQASQRQLDRETQERLAKARNALQADSIRKQHAIATSQLKQRAREAAEQIATSQQRRGALGGGGTTASFSTGAGNFKDHLRRMGVMRG